MNVSSSRRTAIKKRIKETRRSIRKLGNYYCSDGFHITPHNYYVNSMLQSLADLERHVSQDTAEYVVKQEELPF